ncbi:hypothetical protein HID58_015021, partial [Brassica napus]
TKPRGKKSVNLCEFLNKMKEKKTILNKIKKRNVEELKYPISDHYSPDQINQLIQSLEIIYSTCKRGVLMPYDQNMMCMGNNFQDPCLSNIQDYSVIPLELQESVSNYELNQLMPHETFIVVSWSVTLASLKILIPICLQAMLMRTDYFRHLLYHLSSSNLPNETLRFLAIYLIN